LKTLERIPIPKERIVKDLSKELNLNLLIEQIFQVEEEGEVVKFSIQNGPQIIGVFNDSIFNIYPNKVTEVLKELISLIQKKHSVLPKGMFKLKAMSGFAVLSFNSEPPLVSYNLSCSAYKKALQFLKGEEAEKYVLSLS